MADQPVKPAQVADDIKKAEAGTDGHPGNPQTAAEALHKDFVQSVNAGQTPTEFLRGAATALGQGGQDKLAQLELAWASKPGVDLFKHVGRSNAIDGLALNRPDAKSTKPGAEGAFEDAVIVQVRDQYNKSEFSSWSTSITPGDITDRIQALGDGIHAQETAQAQRAQDTAFAAPFAGDKGQKFFNSIAEQTGPGITPDMKGITPEKLDAWLAESAQRKRDGDPDNGIYTSDNTAYAQQLRDNFYGPKDTDDKGQNARNLMTSQEIARLRGQKSYTGGGESATGPGPAITRETLGAATDGIVPPAKPAPRPGDPPAAVGAPTDAAALTSQQTMDRAALDAVSQVPYNSKDNPFQQGTSPDAWDATTTQAALVRAGDNSNLTPEQRAAFKALSVGWPGGQQSMTLGELAKAGGMDPATPEGRQAIADMAAKDKLVAQTVLGRIPDLGSPEQQALASPQGLSHEDVKKRIHAITTAGQVNDGNAEYRALVGLDGAWDKIARGDGSHITKADLAAYAKDNGVPANPTEAAPTAAAPEPPQSALTEQQTTAIASALDAYNKQPQIDHMKPGENLYTFAARHLPPGASNKDVYNYMNQFMQQSGFPPAHLDPNKSHYTPHDLPKGWNGIGLGTDFHMEGDAAQQHQQRLEKAEDAAKIADVASRLPDPVKAELTQELGGKPVTDQALQSLAEAKKLTQPEVAAVEAAIKARNAEVAAVQAQVQAYLRKQAQPPATPVTIST